MVASKTDVVEGKVSFSYPGMNKPCETWYKVVGNLKSSSTGRPLVLLHGGPGFCHNYMLPLELLASKYGVALVFYDQVGCGNSTRLPERRNDFDFWTPELFEAELQNLTRHLGIQEYDLLGHSWGGMLGAQFAIKQPSGPHRLIISNSPASIKSWIDGCNIRRKELSPETQKVISECEEAGDYGNEAYKSAVVEFFKHCVCRKEGENGEPFQKDLMDSIALVEEDNTVYFTMNGPSEMTVIGNLKEWSVVGKLGSICVPTLVLYSEYDAAMDFSVEPFANEIPGVVVKKLKGVSHCCFNEDAEGYGEVLMDFLRHSERS